MDFASVMICTMSTRAITLATCAALATWLVADAAVAQPGTEEPEQTTVQVRPVAADNGIEDDMLLDRAWLTPTALLHSKRSSMFFIEQPMAKFTAVVVSYGIIDHIQLTYVMALPFEGKSWVGNWFAKVRLLNTGRVHAALQGGLSLNVRGNDEANDYLLHGLAVASVCVDRGCHSLISGNVAGIRYIQGSDTLTSAGVSIIGRVHEHLKVVSEVQMTFGEVRDHPASYFFYGLRFTWPQFAGTVGAMTPFSGVFDDKLAPIIPTVNIAMRIN